LPTQLQSSSAQRPDANNRPQTDPGKRLATDSHKFTQHEPQSNPQIVPPPNKTTERNKSAQREC